MEERKSAGISRRKFLKIGALTGVAAQAVTIPAIAYKHGKDFDTYTGYESFEGGTQYINRKPYEIKGGVKELYEKHLPIMGPIERPNLLIEMSPMRMMQIMMRRMVNPKWKFEDGPEGLGMPKEILDHYKLWKKKGFDLFVTDYEHAFVTPKIKKQIHDRYDDHTAITNAFFDAWAQNAAIPEDSTEHPEVSDFKVVKKDMMGKEKTLDIREVNKERKKRNALLKFKTPELAAELIKKVCHQYGATIVGVAKFNPDYVYTHIRGLSTKKMGGIEPPKLPGLNILDPVPKHWKYVVVFGIPHEWDQLVSNPQYGDSLDAYTRLRMCGFRLTEFIKNLGYAARKQVPPGSYDMVLPPYAIEAGLGQFGRMGTVISPETGGNLRLGAVVTNLEMAVDKPIDFGVADFCKKCKICADLCPSGSISKKDEPDQVVRGIKHWEINTASCMKYWEETMGPIGCRLCIAACPFSRKGNWVHGMARAFDPIDPTGLTSSALLWMQKTFWKAPKADEYLPPPDGRLASYRPRPKWLQTEKYFDINVPNPKELQK